MTRDEDFVRTRRTNHDYFCLLPTVDELADLTSRAWARPGQVERLTTVLDGAKTLGEASALPAPRRRATPPPKPVEPFVQRVQPILRTGLPHPPARPYEPLPRRPHPPARPYEPLPRRPHPLARRYRGVIPEPAPAPSSHVYFWLVVRLTNGAVVEYGASNLDTIERLAVEQMENGQTPEAVWCGRNGFEVARWSLAADATDEPAFGEDEP